MRVYWLFVMCGAVGCAAENSVQTKSLYPTEPQSVVLWNYQAEPLLLPTGTVNGEAIGVNDLNEAVGWITLSGAVIVTPVRWDAAGSPTLLPTFAATYGGVAHDVNNAGTVVGEVRGYGGMASLGIAWVGATGYKLHPLPGHDASVGLGVNERDVAVGTSSLGGNSVAVLWRYPGATPVNLHPGGGWTESAAEDINEAGVVVGWARRPFLTHAFQWDASGVAKDLGASVRGRVYSQAFGVSNRNDAAGTQWGLATVWYNSGQITNFMAPDAGLASSISDKLRVVGTQTPSGGYSVGFTGTSANTWELLPGLPPGYSNQAQANDVNTCGTIVGWLHRFNVGKRPVRWVKPDCDRI